MLAPLFFISKEIHYLSLLDYFWKTSPRNLQLVYYQFLYVKLYLKKHLHNNNPMVRIN